MMPVDPLAIEALSIDALRRSLAAGSATADCAADRVGFGAAVIDGPLGGGIPRRALHEIHAPGSADLPAAAGFALALALRAAAGRPILWAREDYLDRETGRPHPPGLAALGLDPAGLVLVRARDAAGVLKAGSDGARCASLGVVLIQIYGDSPLLDLTAGRRLALAAEASGVMTLLLRVSATPAPVAAWTRWQVRAAPSRPLAADAPGHPAFLVTLQRHRGGVPDQAWHLEWNRDRRCFDDRTAADGAPLSRPVVPLPAHGQAPPQASAGGWRKAG